MKRCFIVQCMGFGDSGKGSTVDYLTRKTFAHTVIRFNGGSQSGHNVVTPDGKHHCFSQFGSGTLAGADTFLSKYCLISPKAIINEGNHLIDLGVSDPFSKLFIDSNCLVVTAYHKYLNQAKEILRGGNKHGSCGMGIGEAVEDKLKGYWMTAECLYDHNKLASNLEKIRQFKSIQLSELLGPLALLTPELKSIKNFFDSDVSLMQVFKDMYESGQRLNIVVSDYLEDIIYKKEGTIIFEGAQGALLDQDYGFSPNVSWTDCTYNNANELLKTYDGEVTKLGLVRALPTRHGAGVFPTEDDSLKPLLKNDHNITGLWQGDLRVGWFDMMLLRYAMSITNNEADYLVVSHLDLINNLARLMVCEDYDNFKHFLPENKQAGEDQYYANFRLTEKLKQCKPIYLNCHPEKFIDMLKADGYAIKMESYGPTADEKVWFGI